MDAYEHLTQKWQLMKPQLNERQRRLLAAAEARVLGYGGISLVSLASGLSRATIHKAMAELDEPVAGDHRVRRPGGGRKSAAAQNPALLDALEQLIDPSTRGDPQSPLRWTCKSTRQLAVALTARGLTVSHTVVAELLHQLEYSLQGNAKTLEGKQSPDRDAQFQYISRRTKAFLRGKMPAISVDAKKKELVGTYANGGREWQPRGRPEKVQTHDFPDRDQRKAIPYGVYDLARDEGWVSVGRDRDTATFAIESIRRWWSTMGWFAYPQAKQLLICADAGGSNSYRIRLWKAEVQRFADETRLAVTVCHFPPGTSKWNKIEHRLFSHITMNWRGRPLISHEVVVNLIGNTTTKTGLTVRAELDAGEYPKGITVTKEDFNRIRIRRHRFHGEWNYTIQPA